jgi:nitrite reductase/ring-hydroxylating ferredoxin subunit
MLLSALSGLADYTDTDGAARTRATLHATLMVASVVVLAASILARAGEPADRTVAVVLSVAGALLLTAGAFVGGDVVFAMGNMVSRHAFRGPGAKWLPLEIGGDGSIPDGTPTKAKLGINALVLVRDGATIHALHEQCAHAGGPLSQGRIVDGCIECPWHGSRFRLADGRARRGPTLYDQPVYDVRATDTGGWEARRRGA